ncbi:hypothetical protein DF147_20190 [Burkholderia cenocepacia]|nr:hypothetical protein DF147_20190 [Burkholderia cenocepacia]RQV66972.1 hypothetical protein DF024_08005 [Burkholderia cenocepacia]RQV90467.1 hypothetical protein DF019_07860 [Burkholderia cenocepacia]
MNEELQVISNELDAMVNVLRGPGEQRPLNMAFNNFGIAAVDRQDLLHRTVELADRIKKLAPDDLPVDLEARLSEFAPRLQHTRTSTMPQIFSGNATTAVPAYLLTLDMLERALQPVLSLSKEEEVELAKEMRRLRTFVRSLASRTDAVAPTIEKLQSMADSIVSAYEAADRLPADLQELEESQQKLQRISEAASADGAAMRNLVTDSSNKLELLASRAAAAEKIVEKCEEAMRASTAVGLAAAFQARADELRESIPYWIGGLVLALLTGAGVGGWQLHRLAESIQASTAPTIVWTRFVVSLLSVGAPVWFAWLSTKQIGQRFRLSEDYAYKASVSKAYEGYRREAVNLDEDFQKRLFSTALTRLDEQPLRFVESETHGSPWHEFFSSDVVKNAIRIAPELVGQWKRAAEDTVAAAKSRRKSSQRPANDDSNQAERAG